MLRFQPDTMGEATIQDLMAQFETKHQQCYGFKVDVPVEIVKLRVLGTGKLDQPTIVNLPSRDRNTSATVTGEKRIYIEGKHHDVPLYNRSSLSTGNKITGPALVIQSDSTTLIHPDHAGRIDEHLNLLIETTGYSAQ